MAENKKALVLASVASMIDQFNKTNIEILQSLGYSVDVIADFSDPGNITPERAKILIDELNEHKVRVFDIAIPRSLNPKAILSAYKHVKEKAQSEDYELMHCHSPIGGAIARLAFIGQREKGTKVIYTAHGFHFYKGAPLKNWVVFYTTEKLLSRFTDVLITINKEDFNRAKRRFRAKETVYVPGIGIDTGRFKGKHKGDMIRDEFEIPDKKALVLSVGELNKNKNHETVIKALKGIDAVYMIVGKGSLLEQLKETAEACGVNIRFAGFRTDIEDFYDAADIFVLPSIREGLNVSLMEAMASGLPVACSRIRGNEDLIDDGQGGLLFDPASIEDVHEKIKQLLASDRKEYGRYNKSKISGFDKQTVKKLMTAIYSE